LCSQSAGLILTVGVKLHPWCQQRELVEFCTKQGIAIQAHCAIARNKYSSRAGFCVLAEKYSKSTAQILIRYSHQKGWTPIVKAISEAHLHDNAQASDFAISQEDMELMDSWDKGLEGAICMYRNNRIMLAELMYP
jgi:diketogulonate reductase-like aldo/keto reductase